MKTSSVSPIYYYMLSLILIYPDLIGRTRRSWRSEVYLAFHKATLVRDANGVVAKVKAENGNWYAQYQFKCKT